MFVRDVNEPKKNVFAPQFFLIYPFLCVLICLTRHNKSINLFMMKEFFKN